MIGVRERAHRHRETAGNPSLTHRFIEVSGERGPRARDIGFECFLREVAGFGRVGKFRVSAATFAASKRMRGPPGPPARRAGTAGHRPGRDRNVRTSRPAAASADLRRRSPAARGCRAVPAPDVRLRPRERALPTPSLRSPHRGLGAASGRVRYDSVFSLRPRTPTRRALPLRRSHDTPSGAQTMRSVRRKRPGLPMVKPSPPAPFARRRFLRTPGRGCCRSQSSRNIVARLWPQALEMVLGVLR